MTFCPIFWYLVSFFLDASDEEGNNQSDHRDDCACDERNLGTSGNSFSMRRSRRRCNGSAEGKCCNHDRCSGCACELLERVQNCGAVTIEVLRKGAESGGHERGHHQTHADAEHNVHDHDHPHG